MSLSSPRTCRPIRRALGVPCALLLLLAWGCGEPLQPFATDGFQMLLHGEDGPVAVPCRVLGASPRGGSFIALDEVAWARTPGGRRGEALPLLGARGREGAPLLDASGALHGILLPPAGNEGPHGETMPIDRVHAYEPAVRRAWEEAKERFAPRGPATIQPGAFVWSLEVWGDVAIGEPGTVTSVKDGLVLALGRDGMGGRAPCLLAAAWSLGEVDEADGEGVWTCATRPLGAIGGEFLQTPVGHFARLDVVPLSTQFTVRWRSEEFPPVVFHTSRWWPAWSHALDKALGQALEPLHLLDGITTESASVVVHLHGPRGATATWTRNSPRSVPASLDVPRWVVEHAEAWRRETGPEHFDAVEIVVERGRR